MRAMIIGGGTRGRRRALFGPFQLVLGVDEKAAEGDDLVAVVHSIENLCVELALNAGADFLRRVVAGLLLNVHDVLVAFLDDRLVWDREEWTLFDDNLHHIQRRILAARGRKGRLDRRPSGPRNHTRDECLIHRRLGAGWEGSNALADLDQRGLGSDQVRGQYLVRLVDRACRANPALYESRRYGADGQRQRFRLRLVDASTGGPDGPGVLVDAGAVTHAVSDALSGQRSAHQQREREKDSRLVNQWQ